jgi:hypothetical protein
MDERTKFRADVLAVYGAGRQETEELLRYNENVFDRGQISSMKFPLADEPFVASWEGYIQEVEREGTIKALEKYLIQLRFPVRAGMSKDSGYIAATTMGAEPPPAAATGLGLLAPEHCSVTLYPTPAGRIPMIVTAVRDDFVLLVWALTRRNEPFPLPDSMGACMIAGYRNWHRIRMISSSSGPEAPFDPFSVQLQNRLRDKSAYQDRFIILSNGYYSGVSPAEIGLPDERWRQLSVLIRREHECAHYFTRRVFASMRNNLIDEIIADYCGIVAAQGFFRSDWMLRFLGLEHFPAYRAGARLENYRGTPTLSPAAFQVLQRLVKQVAENLEVADREIFSRNGRGEPLSAILPLSLFTLEELASVRAVQSLQDAFLAGTTISTLRRPPPASRVEMSRARPGTDT